jgi:hypothetical protein
VPDSIRTRNDVLRQVEQELEADGGYDLRASVTRLLVRSGLGSETKQSITKLESMASSAVQFADVALLAAWAGEHDRGTRLAERADAALTHPDGASDELAIWSLATAWELLELSERAAAAVARLPASERRDAAIVVARDVARAGWPARARKWADSASRESVSVDAWVPVARAYADAAATDAAREALAIARRGAGEDSAALAEVADVYARIGDGSDAARLARRIRPRVLSGDDSAEPAYLIRAALAGGDRRGATAVARHASDTPSFIMLVQAAILYLDFDVDPPESFGTDRRAFAESLLASAERAIATGAERQPSFVDAIRAYLVRARLRTGDVARAVEQALAISERATRLGALVEIASHC